MIQLFIAASVAFIFTIFATPLAIRFLRGRNIGQFIQDDVQGHMHKLGTPTMGRATAWIHVDRAETPPQGDVRGSAAATYSTES